MWRLMHFVRFSGSSRQTEAPEKRHGSRFLNVLLIIPFLGLLWPPLYAKSDPHLFGFPFFYWYQFAWVIGSAVLTGIVYLATHRR